MRALPRTGPPDSGCQSGANTRCAMHPCARAPTVRSDRDIGLVRLWPRLSPRRRRGIRLLEIGLSEAVEMRAAQQDRRGDLARDVLEEVLCDMREVGVEV